MNIKINTIEKNKPKAGRRGLRGSSLAAVFAEGLLSAALMFGLGACDGLSGLPEDISNNNGDALLNAIDLTISPIAMTSKTWVINSDQDVPVPVLYVSASLKAADGEIKFEWYKAGPPDVMIQEDEALPGVPVKYELNRDDLNNQTASGSSLKFYVKAIYLNKEKVSDMAVVSFVAPGYVLDSDEDGYPDDWEEEPIHQSEGYDPNRADQPYGIDLSRRGAVPDGVNLVWVNNNGANMNNVYTVYGVPSEGVNEYRVYHSSDTMQYVSHIHLAAAVDTDSGGDITDLSRSTVELIISDDVDTLYITSETERYGSGASLVIGRGANVKITLDGIKLTGGAPIGFERDEKTGLADAKLTLLLRDESTLTAGSVYSDAAKRFYAAAGISVPEGAALIIDKAEDDTSSLFDLNVTGFTGNGDDPTKWDRRLSSWGAGAGIGSGQWDEIEPGYKTGSITIQGDITVTATGGAAGYNWGGAAGIGGGGQWNTDDAKSIDDTTIITISGGVVNATGGENAAGIGGGYKRSAGTITIDLEKSSGTATANSTPAGLEAAAEEDFPAVGPGNGYEGTNGGSFNGGDWPTNTSTYSWGTQVD